MVKPELARKQGRSSRYPSDRVEGEESGLCFVKRDNYRETFPFKDLTQEGWEIAFPVKEKK